MGEEEGSDNRARGKIEEIFGNLRGKIMRRHVGAINKDLAGVVRCLAEQVTILSC